VLSAIVIPTKSELGIFFSFSRIFSFVLLEDEQNLGMGVFVQP